MPFSFSASRRREANRNHPHVRAMLATAEWYGYNSGSPVDRSTFELLLASFARELPGARAAGVESLVPQLTEESIASTFPMAVDAAWAVAALMPNNAQVTLTQAMGHTGAVAAATWFTDEFPGKVKTPVAGRRVKLWRSPAAIAAVLLASGAGVPRR